MLHDLDDFAILFNKIKDDKATEDERAQYEIGIKTSCLNEAVLRSLIEARAKELKS